MPPPRGFTRHTPQDAKFSDPSKIKNPALAAIAKDGWVVKLSGREGEQRIELIGDYLRGGIQINGKEPTTEYKGVLRAADGEAHFNADIAQELGFDLQSPTGSADVKSFSESYNQGVFAASNNLLRLPFVSYGLDIRTNADAKTQTIANYYLDADRNIKLLVTTTNAEPFAQYDPRIEIAPIEGTVYVEFTYNRTSKQLLITSFGASNAILDGIIGGDFTAIRNKSIAVVAPIVDRLLAGIPRRDYATIRDNAELIAAVLCDAPGLVDYFLSSMGSICNAFSPSTQPNRPIFYTDVDNILQQLAINLKSKTPVFNEQETGRILYDLFNLLWRFSTGELVAKDFDYFADLSDLLEKKLDQLNTGQEALLSLSKNPLFRAGFEVVENIQDLIIAPALGRIIAAELQDIQSATARNVLLELAKSNYSIGLVLSIKVEKLITSMLASTCPSLGSIDQLLKLVQMPEIHRSKELCTAMKVFCLVAMSNFVAYRFSQLADIITAAELSEDIDRGLQKIPPLLPPRSLSVATLASILNNLKLLAATETTGEAIQRNYTILQHLTSLVAAILPDSQLTETHLQNFATLYAKFVTMLEQAPVRIAGMDFLSKICEKIGATLAQLVKNPLIPKELTEYFQAQGNDLLLTINRINLFLATTKLLEPPDKLTVSNIETFYSCIPASPPNLHQVALGFLKEKIGVFSSLSEGQAEALCPFIKAHPDIRELCASISGCAQCFFASPGTSGSSLSSAATPSSSAQTSLQVAEKQNA